jgi:hypothetical protein
MNDSENKSVMEFERIHRVSNLLCSSHADLRDKYSMYSFLLDMAILSLSTWIVALAFIDPKLTKYVVPFGMDPQMWIGAIGVGTFLLSLLQLRVDWKGRADSHKRAFEVYSDVKQLAGRLLSAKCAIGALADEVQARYLSAGSNAVSIPENQFLRLKMRHLTKIEISKILDVKPASSIMILRLRLWVRDNLTRHSADK